MPTLFAAFEDRVLRIAGEGEDWSLETVHEGTQFEAVAGHPDAPDRIVVGTIDDGVHRSLDGGITWERVGEPVVTDRVASLASDPSDADRFYLGTEPSAVYRSNDGGDTWSAMDGLTNLRSSSTWSFPPRPHTHHVRWIEVDPSEPPHLYVGIEAGALLQTYDRGETWVDRVETARIDVHELETHPDAPGEVWCAAGDGFAESTDGGTTWEYPQSGLDHHYCWSVAADPANPTALVLSAARGPRTAHNRSTAESYVYRRDGGTWVRAGEGLPDGTGMLRPVLTRGFEPGSIFAATNSGCFRTTTAGEEWTRIDVPWPDVLDRQTPRGLLVNP